jgi:hypothetical protein
LVVKWQNLREFTLEISTSKGLGRLRQIRDGSRFIQELIQGEPDRHRRTRYG